MLAGLDYTDRYGLFSIKISTSLDSGSNRVQMNISSSLLKKFEDGEMRYIGVTDVKFYPTDRLSEVSKSYIRSNIRDTVKAYNKQILIEEIDLYNLLNNVYENLKKAYR